MTVAAGRALPSETLVQLPKAKALVLALICVLVRLTALPPGRYSST